MIDASTWTEYVGQEKMKARLRTHLAAALNSTRPLESILLTGPPGVGKTTLARIIAQEVNDPLVEAIMPVSDRFLRMTVMTHRGILFLDEIHRGSKKQQEQLLTLVGGEAGNGYLQLANGQSLFNDWLTVIGATTDPENIIPPLYSRFTIKPLWEPYSPEDMALIVKGMAERLGVELSEDVIGVLGGAAAGHPRTAKALVKAARDLADSNHETPTAAAILDLCGISSKGLTEQNLLYLQSLKQLGGRAGLNVLCTLLQLHPKIVQDMERVLITKGLIEYTATGRELTSAGYAQFLQ